MNKLLFLTSELRQRLIIRIILRKCVTAINNTCIVNFSIRSFYLQLINVIIILIEIVFHWYSALVFERLRELISKFLEHHVLESDEKVKFALPGIFCSRCEVTFQLHDVTFFAEGLIIPPFLFISLWLAPILEGHCALISVGELLVDTHSRKALKALRKMAILPWVWHNTPRLVQTIGNIATIRIVILPEQQSGR